MNLQNTIFCAAIYITAQQLSLCHAYAGEQNMLSGSVYETVGVQKNIDPFLLYSISLLESAGRTSLHGFVAPSPYAIRTPEGAFYPNTYAEAVSELDKQISKYGKRKLDIGLMQINGQHWNKVKEPKELFNPYTNVRIGAEILEYALSCSDDLELAIGRYHSPTDWRARNYGSRVLAVYRNLQEFK